jgi:hypothetical protein
LPRWWSTPRGPNFSLIGRILLSGIVQLFRFLLVQVIEIAEPFVETMNGGEELVAVAQMVLPNWAVE